MSFAEELVHLHCANCAIEFGITEALHKRRLKDHSGFYCPNGHGNVFTADAPVEDDEDEEEEQEAPQLGKKQMEWKHKVYQITDTTHEQN